MSKNITSKKSLYYTILNSLKEDGSNLTNLSKKLSISKQKLNYYLRRLENFGCIEKVSRGYYEVKHLDLEHTIKSKVKQIRGHAFIWSIKVPKEIKGWEERLKKFKVNYNLVRGMIPRIILKNRKIWLGKKTITIYETNSFYGNNSLESRKYAVVGLLEVLGAIERRLEINLRPYVFKPRREHYGYVKNILAQQCNRDKEKIYVRDNLEGEWLWIDDSESLGELETGGPKAMGRSLQVQKWFNDHKKHDFKVTPSFVLQGLNQVTQNQIMFNQNFESHVEAIRTLSQSVKDLRIEISRLKNANNKR